MANSEICMYPFKLPDMYSKLIIFSQQDGQLINGIIVSVSAVYSYASLQCCKHTFT